MVESYVSTATPPAQKPHKPGFLKTVVALMLREMSTTYGRSMMGYVWAVLEPAAGIILLTFIFSLALRAPSIGTNFPLFFASGILPFSAFVTLHQRISVTLRFSKSLLFYPGVTYIDALIARLLLNAMTLSLIGVVVFTGIIKLYDLDVFINPYGLVLGYFMAFSLALGVGILNCVLLSLYPIWERVWAITTRPLLIISCVLFIFDSVPMPYKDWLWWNPLIHVVGQTRSAIYASYDATYVMPLYVFSISLITLATGLLLLRRFYTDIINN